MEDFTMKNVKLFAQSLLMVVAFAGAACEKKPEGEVTGKPTSGATTSAPTSGTMSAPTSGMMSAPATTPVSGAMSAPASTPTLSPSPTSGDLDAAAEKLAKYMEDTGAAVEAAAGDCDKAADGARAVWEKNKDAMKGMMAMATATPEQQKVMQEKYGPRMEAAEKKMGDLDAKCKDNAKWQQLEKDMTAAMGMPQ
jgi:hypothetical protein